MEPVYDIRPHADLLDSLNRDGSGDVIRRIAERTREEGCRRLLDTLHEYESVLAELAVRIRHHGKLQDDDYTALKHIFDKIQIDLVDATQVDIKREELDEHGRGVLWSLHLLGGLEVAKDFGNAALFVGPNMLTRALSVVSLLDSRSRAKHIEAIAKIRGEETLTQLNAEEQERRYVQPFAKELRETLRQLAIHAVPPCLPTEGAKSLFVEYLPTATDFYEAGIHYYGDPAGRGRKHYILATTSGILLPEDFHGSLFFEEILPLPELAKKTDKNPRREEYFRALADVRGNTRCYFFEIKRARIAFQKTLADIKQYGNEKCEQYKNHSRKTIAQFLRLKGFGLFGVEQFPEGFDHLTLGNNRHMLLSLRDKPERKHKIGHGLWVRPSSSTPEEVKRLVDAIDLESVTAALVAAVGVRAVSDSMLDAFLTGFAVPLAFALRRVISRKQAEESTLAIGMHIVRSLRPDFPFFRPPDSKPMSERQALNQADRILSLLETPS